MTNKRIVFMHIPKTAGIAVIRHLGPSLLQNGYSEQMLCPARDRDIAQMPDHALKNYYLFSGHYSYDQVCRIPEPKLLFTMLREPRERIFSLYNYLRLFRWEAIQGAQARGDPNNALKCAAKCSSLLDFLLCPEPEVRVNVDNAITGYLIGAEYRDANGSLRCSDEDAFAIAIEHLRGFAAVGVCEHTASFLRATERAIGIKLPDTLPVENEFWSLRERDVVDREKVEPVNESDLDAATEEALSYSTRIDSKVYAIVLQMCAPELNSGDIQERRQEDNLITNTENKSHPSAKVQVEA